MGNKFVKLIGLVMLLSSLSIASQVNAGEVGAYDTKGETTFIGDPYEFPTEPEEPKDPGKTPPPTPPKTPEKTPPRRPSYPGTSGGSTSNWTGGGGTSSGSGGIIPRTGDQPWYISVIQGSLILSLMGILIINFKKIR